MESDKDPPPSNQSGNSDTKNTKPLMEKRRRARINASLVELKSLLMESIKKEGVCHSKMEKADILEAAVRHLKQTQRQSSTATPSSPPVIKHRYGFSECTQEVNRFLSNIDGCNVELRTQLLDHLSNVLSHSDHASTSVNRLPVSSTSSSSAASSSGSPCSVVPAQTQLSSPLYSSQIQMDLSKLFSSSSTPAGDQQSETIMPTTLKSSELAFVLPTNIPGHYKATNYLIPVYTSAHTPVTFTVSPCARTLELLTTLNTNMRSTAPNNLPNKSETITSPPISTAQDIQLLSTRSQEHGVDSTLTNTSALFSKDENDNTICCSGIKERDKRDQFKGMTIESDINEVVSSNDGDMKHDDSARHLKIKLETADYHRTTTCETVSNNLLNFDSNHDHAASGRNLTCDLHNEKPTYLDKDKHCHKYHLYGKPASDHNMVNTGINARVLKDIGHLDKDTYNISARAPTYVWRHKDPTRGSLLKYSLLREDGNSNISDCSTKYHWQEDGTICVDLPKDDKTYCDNTVKYDEGLTNKETGHFENISTLVCKEVTGHDDDDDNDVNQLGSPSHHSLGNRTSSNDSDNSPRHEREPAGGGVVPGHNVLNADEINQQNDDIVWRPW